MRSLIIGAGEIGKSLHEVLKTKHEIYLKDKEDMPMEGIEVLNICYPYSKTFIKDTKEYIKQYNPKVVIIHSTVPVGTTRKCGNLCVHSPCHGIHPNLSQGIRTFVKYIGGKNIFAVFQADKFLSVAGIDTEIVSSSETSELSKILCTTYYGWNIVFMKEVARICNDLDLPFKEVYHDWNTFYNDGYSKLGSNQFNRPVLNPIDGEIGGHCVVNNTFLLKDFITKTIQDRNEIYKGGKNEKRKRS